MKQKTLLATAIAAALLLQTWSIAAQDAAPAADQSKAKSLDTVTVTGSRIRSVDVETSQPIFTMDRQAIQATGLTNVNDILARMPSAGTPDLTPQDTLASGTDVGGRYVNIRNLGSTRTLVLVNGRRWSTTLGGLTDAPLISTGRQLAAGATETICIQVTLPASANTSLQGATSAVSFTFTGTSDLS